MSLLRNKNARVPDPNSFSTSPGAKFHVNYASFFNADGTICLKEAGCTDIQAEINSHVSETDMALIISKLQRGDTSVLTSKKPMFGDFTKLPSSFSEAFELVTRSEQAFESLDPHIKQQFDNDRAKWFSSIGSDEWYEKMNIPNPNKPAPVEPPAPIPDKYKPGFVPNNKEVVE